MAFLGHGKIAIAATEAGPDDGPLVLLAHGGGQTKRAWRKATDRLNAGGFRTVAIDLRGHGESGWAADAAYDLSDFARDILSVVDQLGRPPAFVGASLGGLAGLIAEGELRPGTFASLTLVDVTPRMDPEGAGRIGAFMSRHVEDGFASLEEAAAVIGDYTANREKRGASEGLSHYLKQRADGRYRWHWDPAFMQAGTVRFATAADRLERAARALRLPVQLVRGQKSELVSEEAAKAFLEFVPGARFDDIAGAGHMIVGDRNDAFSDAIWDFLADILGDRLPSEPSSRPA
jgi:pimeloyl-ACP methyl ester carboxylesterase